MKISGYLLVCVLLVSGLCAASSPVVGVGETGGKAYVEPMRLLTRWVISIPQDHQRFQYTKYSYCDLHGLQTNNCCFADCIFYRCNMQNISFDSCEFTRCTFVNVDMHNFHMNACKINGCKFIRCAMCDGIVSGGHVGASIFSDCTQSMSRWEGCSFYACVRFEQCNLSNAFVDTNFYNACRLPVFYVEFVKCVMDGLCFKNELSENVKFLECVGCLRI